MLKEEDYYSYTKGVSGIASAISLKKRKILFEKFIYLSGIKSTDTILDVGATADSDNAESNFLEMLYSFKDKITATGISDASFLEKKYPGLRFVQANALHLPFADASYDYVFSNAVIEHVGSSADQLVFLKELARVARKGVFIATPNRWFLIETHHCLFFVHWLPQKWFRRILYLLKRFEYCEENVLNLLSYRQLYKMCGQAGIVRFNIYRTRLFGFTSNLMLYINKTLLKAV